MTKVIYPINGRNERIGKLFKTPKHLLRYKGEVALQDSVQYMSQFGEVTILCRPEYYDDIFKLTDSPYFKPDIFQAKESDSVIDTVRQINCLSSTGVWFVDCDVIPIKLNPPKGNTAYLFRNDKKLKHYSNFTIRDGYVLEANEKSQLSEWAGSGVYYFTYAESIYDFAASCKTFAQVINKMCAHVHLHPEDTYMKVKADTTSEIFRFGTLEDITG